MLREWAWLRARIKGTTFTRFVQNTVAIAGNFCVKVFRLELSKEYQLKTACAPIALSIRILKFKFRHTNGQQLLKAVSQNLMLAKVRPQFVYY